MAAPSLAELIAADDPDAIAGFRDSHVHKVRAYCAEACPQELRDEASDAAFIDFLGRVAMSRGGDAPLEELLLKATRGAAAGRFRVQVPAAVSGRVHGRTPEPICLAMPELLAAYSNNELTGEDKQARRHLERCLTCAETMERMERAERAFAGAQGWDEPEPVAAVPDPELVASVPQPPPGPEPVPTPQMPPAHAPPAPQVVRARRGGLVGAARRLMGHAPDEERSRRP